MDKINSQASTAGLVAKLLQESKQATEKHNHQLNKTAKDFDALMIHNLLNKLVTHEGDSLFGESFANEIFYDMMNQEYAKLFAERGDVGFSKAIIEQYSKKQ